MKSLLLSVLICFAMFSFGCSGSGNSNAQPTPTPDNAKTRAARAEQDFQEGLKSIENEEGEFRTAGRNAVAEFIRTKLPGWTLKGISAQPYSQNVFSMDAEIEKQAQHVVLTFDVRKFFSESGDGYWLAVPVNKFRADRIQALVESDLRKQLAQAQTELDELKNPPSDDSEPEP